MMKLFDRDKEIKSGPPNIVDEGPLYLRRSLGDLKLAILLPTRGLIFSLAMESILREGLSIHGLEVAIFFAHSLPIPECQNVLIDRAIKWGAEWTWLVEEDNYMPFGVLRALLNLYAPISTCDYYNHEGNGLVIRPHHGGVDYYAFGCTLVNTVVWSVIGQPYCSIDPRYTYGGQDIDFSLRVHRARFKGKRLALKRWRCGHLHVEVPGHSEHNSGAHTIRMQ